MPFCPVGTGFTRSYGAMLIVAKQVAVVAPGIGDGNPGRYHICAMRLLWLSLIFVSQLAWAGNDEKVTVKVNGKEARPLAEGLYLKPGSYKAAPKVAYKRADLQSLDITAPTAGLEGPADSLLVKVSGMAGSIPYYKVQQNVAPGGQAHFDIAEGVRADYTPNGKQQTLVGRLEIEVTPLKRANTKGQYKGTITIE